jgi:hypothetical protein
VPRSTKPKMLANTNFCQGIRRSRCPASEPLMFGIWPAKSSAASTRAPLKLTARRRRPPLPCPAGSVHRRGAPGAAPARTRVDRALVKALAWAHRWKRLLESRRYGSLAELTAAEKIDRSYLGKMLRLTLLAPDIVEAMLDGWQAPELGTPQLIEPLPAAWSEQRQVLLSARHVPCCLPVQPSLDC